MQNFFGACLLYMYTRKAASGLATCMHACSAVKNAHKELHVYIFALTYTHTHTHSYSRFGVYT